MFFANQHLPVLRGLLIPARALVTLPASRGFPGDGGRSSRDSAGSGQGPRKSADWKHKIHFEQSYFKKQTRQNPNFTSVSKDEM